MALLSPTPRHVTRLFGVWKAPEKPWTARGGCEMPWSWLSSCAKADPVENRREMSGVANAQGTGARSQA